MIGETFGSYKVTARIGEGGMGVVYLAEHTLLGRKAAIKVLLPEHSQRQDLIERFFNEAKTAATLKHPALVDVFDFGVHASGSAYLVMDFLEGESLGARLAKTGALSPAVAVEIAGQIARGVEAAHQHGIVHRDLKPDNVFLEPDAEHPGRERVRILDFGIAKLMGAVGTSKGVTSTGMVLGTPLFMAPEQCRGAGKIDHRADIYSLGCILYMMLGGRPPFEYEGVGELLGAHLYEPVRPIGTRNPGVPGALEAVVTKSLEKKPEDRYASMAEFAAALETAMPGTAGSMARSREIATSQTMAAGSAPTTLQAAASQVQTVPEKPVRAARSRSAAVFVLAGGGALMAGAGLLAFALMREPKSGAPKPAAAARAADAESVLAWAHPAAVPDATTIVNAMPLVDAAPPHDAVQLTDTTTAAVNATAPDAPALPEREPGRATDRHDRNDRKDRAGRTASANASANRLYLAGVAQLARGDERAALENMRAYLRHQDLPASQRADAERVVLRLQKNFGEIEVLCEVDGAEVRIDGRVVGHTPLSKSILLPPGLHQLDLSKPGYRPVQKRFTLTAGQRQPFRFRFSE